MEKIDVCIPTLNAGKTLGVCLFAIQSVIPYGKIIIVDGYSTDDTVDIAKTYGCEIHYCKGRLGAARNMLMKLAGTKWFAFIDSDVMVNGDWLYKLLTHIDDRTGAINGFGLPNNFLLSNFRKVMLFTKLELGIKQRGFTSNTLVRKEAVRGIKLPDVKRTEDILLQQEVEKRNWEWKMIPVWCTHMKTGMQIIKEAKGDFFEIAKREGFFKALTRL
jgi:glycosyltransferase involved in cell wall biosynthesis